MAKIQHGHPPEEMFEQYSLGHLTESDCEPFEDHLLVCSECQDHLAAIDAEISDIKEVCRTTPAPAAERREPRLLAWLFAVPKPIWAAAAAGLILAVSVPVYREAAAPRGETEVTIQTSRGRQPELAAAPAGTRLKLNIDVAELALAGPCRVDLVNADGETAWTGEGRASSGRVSASGPKRLPAGQYWVRIFNQSGQFLRESALVLK